MLITPSSRSPAPVSVRSTICPWCRHPSYPSPEGYLSTPGRRSTSLRSQCFVPLGMGTLSPNWNARTPARSMRLAGYHQGVKWLRHQTERLIYTSTPLRRMEQAARAELLSLIWHTVDLKRYLLLETSPKRAPGFSRLIIWVARLL